MKRNLIVIVLMIFFLPLTVSALVSRNKIASIQPGLTLEQVQKILGDPDFMQFRDNYRQWGYHKSVGSVLDATWQQIVVTFRDGKVISMTSQPLPPRNADNQRDVLPVPPIFPEYYPEQMTMNSNEFQTLLGLVKNAPNEGNKMALVEAGSLNSQFSASQVAIIMSLFPNENERMKVLRFMGPHIVVMDNTSAIMEQLSSSNNLLEAAVILGEE